MEHDYYAILGVAETADRAEIWRAYRRLAYEHHPDRGGTHSQMVLLNKAWEMLGNPERRRHYDQVRRAPADAAAQSEYRRDEAAAQRSAEQYPAEWAALEKWWRSVAQDMAETEYGSWLFDLNAKGRTVEAMILYGGLIGFGVGIVLATSIDYSAGRRAVVNALAAAVGVPSLIGMVAGKVLHYLLSSFIRLGGTGASPIGIRLTEAEWRRIGTSALLGLIGLLVIADNSEPKLATGMTRAAVQTAFEESAYDKLKSGFLRGAILGAVACLLLAKYELAQSAAYVRHEKLPEYFPYRAALYGGLALGAAAFLFEFFSVPKSSGTIVIWRMVVGGLWGAAASALTLLAIKQTAVAESAAKGEDSAAEPNIVACLHCGQKLRIPQHSEELRVTCPVCKGRFEFGGKDGSAAG